MITNVPLQRLFFMNSAFVEQQAQALADRFAGEPEIADSAACIAPLFTPRARGRGTEARAGVSWRRASWTSYARVLLSSNEFTFVD